MIKILSITVHAKRHAVAKDGDKDNIFEQRRVRDIDAEAPQQIGLSDEEERNFWIAERENLKT